jgi:hypothetical protein
MEQVAIDVSNSEWIQTSIAPRVCAFPLPHHASDCPYPQFAPAPTSTIDMTQQSYASESRSNHTSHVRVDLPSATFLVTESHSAGCHSKGRNLGRREVIRKIKVIRCLVRPSFAAHNSSGLYGIDTSERILLMRETSRTGRGLVRSRRNLAFFLDGTDVFGNLLSGSGYMQYIVNVGLEISLICVPFTSGLLSLRLSTSHHTFFQ